MEPLFVVTGATGNTGSAVARNLLAASKRVRAVGRNAGRLDPLAAAGAEPFVCDLTDSRALAQAFSGAQAVYAMIPPDTASTDYRAHQDRITDAMAAALKKARVQYAVTLSSVGADLPAKTGPIVGQHYMEQQFNGIAKLNVLHLRAGYFMENLLAQVGIIKATGYAAGTLRTDLPLPLIATRDIGSAAAEALMRLSFKGRQTRELLGPRDVSMAEAAGIIGAVIGKPDLEYVQAAQSQAREVLVQIGISPNVAELILEMSAAWNACELAATEARSASNTTPTTLETFAREQFVRRIAEWHPAVSGKTCAKPDNDKVFLAAGPSRAAPGAFKMAGPRRWLFLTLLLAQQAIPAGQYPGSLLAGLRWRDVGPMRGGRTYAVAGHAEPARHLLFRLRGRRRVEDRELRPHLVSHLR